MEIHEVVRSGIAVITLRGKMMGGPETHDLHVHVKTLIGKGVHHLVIDLGPLEWLNSAGMGVLIASLMSLRNAGGNLVIANVGEKVYSLLEMTHLHLVFQKYNSVDQAIEGFGKLK